MKYRFFFCFAMGTIGVFGQAQKPAAKTADMCSPPPGSVAPSLPAKILEGQGTVHLPITTRSEEAQKFFDQGVAQMHSFWAREAERSFLQAAALDPEAPMPYWGIAMVAGGDWRPRFQIDTAQASFGKQNSPTRSRASDAAKKAIELSQAPGKATELEKMYIKSVAARRDARQKDPNEAFVKGLRSLLAKYPDEIEAKLELALMIMRGFTLPDKKPRTPRSMEAATILRELAIQVPDHPGVHHYIIHGFEGSTFAKDAWPSCKRYSELVTNIPHALHMPGHIYSQTGKWEEAVNSFASAAENERGYMKADALYGSGHHGHNVHYLATSYSFQGQYDKALEAAAGLLALKETPREAKLADNIYGAYAQGWFGTLRTLVQFEKWDEILKQGILPEPTKARQLAWMHWAKGLAYSAKQQLAEATSERKAMDEAIASYRQKTKLKIPEELVVARKELDGYIEIAANRVDKGIRKLQSAASSERHLRYSEPPYYPRPVSEQLGRVALKNGKLPEAERAFRQALEQYPASSHALAGLRDTLQKGGKPLEAGL